MKDLHSVWGKMSIDDRICFLADESTQLIWTLRKNSDKGSLEEFRERLEANLDFADVELHELEIKDKITALLTAGIDADTADELSELAKEIRRGYGKLHGDVRPCA